MFIAVLCEEYLQCTKVFITILCRGLLAAYNSADYRAGHPLVEPVAGRPAAGRELEQQQGQRQAGHQHTGSILALIKLLLLMGHLQLALPK